VLNNPTPEPDKQPINPVKIYPLSNFFDCVTSGSKANLLIVTIEKTLMRINHVNDAGDRKSRTKR
jgi:hypothetical protein